MVCCSQAGPEHQRGRGSRRDCCLLRNMEDAPAKAEYSPSPKALLLRRVLLFSGSQPAAWPCAAAGGITARFCVRWLRFWWSRVWIYNPVIFQMLIQFVTQGEKWWNNSLAWSLLLPGASWNMVNDLEQHLNSCSRNLLKLWPDVALWYSFSTVIITKVMRRSWIEGLHLTQQWSAAEDTLERLSSTSWRLLDSQVPRLFY